MMQEIQRAMLPLWPRYPEKLLRNYIRFWRGFFAYGRLQGKAPCALRDLDLQIGDWHATTPINYYFFQDTWAFHKIAQTRPAWHADIGSTALLVGCLAGIVPTLSVDIRPLAAKLPGLQGISGLITQLPFASSTLPSVSALCVVEHIGLGRYGDPLDPDGTRKAARELVRVLTPGGNLYVSAPCGRSYVAFNAHRSFERSEFISLFEGLVLTEYRLINNWGVTETAVADPRAGLHVGLFHFTK